MTDFLNKVSDTVGGVISESKDFVDKGISSLIGGSSDRSQNGGFNAQNILSNLSQQGVAHSSHFEVQVIWNNSPSPNLQYRAESAELPGRTLSTVDHRFDNYSPMQKVVTGQVYTDATITFLLSEDLREKEFFEIWQNAAVQTGAFTNEWKEPLNSATPNTTKHNVKYFKDYVGRVIIRQYGAAGDIRSVHTLLDAYPIAIGGIQMSWSDESHARMPIQFTYKSYKSMFYKQDQPTKGISAGFSLGPGGFAGSLQIPGVGSFNTSSGLGSQLKLGGISKKIFSSPINL